MTLLSDVDGSDRGPSLVAKRSVPTEHLRQLRLRAYSAVAPEIVIATLTGDRRLETVRFPSVELQPGAEIHPERTADGTISLVRSDGVVIATAAPRISSLSTRARRAPRWAAVDVRARRISSRRGIVTWRVRRPARGVRYVIVGRDASGRHVRISSLRGRRNRVRYRVRSVVPRRVTRVRIRNVRRGAVARSRLAWMR